MDVAKEKLNGKIKTVTIFWDVMGKEVEVMENFR